MKQIELTEKLNKIKKERLNPIKDLSIFLKLYFKNIKIFKGELFLKPALTICSILLLVSSFGVYSYNSTSVVYGSNLYKIKIGIENKILANKKTSEEKINYYAIKALGRGGYLATCSCSHFMDNDKFVDMLKNVARKANVNLKQIEVRQQSMDHPILWNVKETDYLKFYIFQII